MSAACPSPFPFGSGPPSQLRGAMRFLKMLVLTLLLSLPTPSLAQDSSLVLAFADAVPRQFSLMYREFHTEFQQCLYGMPKGDSVFILIALNANLPPSQSRPRTAGPNPQSDTLAIEPCPWGFGNAGALGLAHPHKNVSEKVICDMSESDQLFEFEHRQDALAVVICGPTRFAIYRRESYKTRREVCTFNPEALDIKLTCIEELAK